MITLEEFIAQMGGDSFVEHCRLYDLHPSEVMQSIRDHGNFTKSRGPDRIEVSSIADDVRRVIAG